MPEGFDELDQIQAIRTEWLPSSDWDDVLDLPSVAPEIRAEYLRWVEIIGEDDPYAGPNTLGIHDVLKAHFLIADFFYAMGEGLGGIGPRDPTLLHSALYRQHIAFQGNSKWDNHFDVAATLLFGLIKDHPFHDANKRTAFLSTLYYLYGKGCVPRIHQKYFEEFTVEIADDKLGRYARYIALLKKSDDPEVKHIAYWLKSNTRKMDKRHYLITYVDLDRILGTFGLTLDSPEHNHIDVVRRETKRGIFGLGEKIVQTRVCRIGFPGWTKQVSEKDIKIIRNAANLTHQFGVDSQTFFKGVDSLGALIAEYEPALRRLAER
jgi:death-on-curing protein